MLDVKWAFHPDNDWVLKIVSPCFKSCPKTFSALDFKGDVTEMRFLKHLFDNAVMLEIVKLFRVDHLTADLKKQMKINDQLQAFQRGLTSCVLEFCDQGEWEFDDA